MNEPQDSETITVTTEEAGSRLDRILASRYKEVQSRTYFQNLLEDHYVLLNGQPAKKNAKPKEGDEVEIFFKLTAEINVVPENIPLNILYEDGDILSINKPPGLVVHPAPGNWSGTFVNALLYHCKNLCNDKTELRPGIVHRLDKDTSGVLVAAKNSRAQQRLIELFAGREVHKEYLAICLGNPGEGKIDLPIGRHPVHRKKMAVLEEGGREARTHFKTLAFDGKLGLVSIIIETGRTHQIRVHMSHRKTPVLGDLIYGNPSANEKYHTDRQMLHAHLIRFRHPITKKEVEIVAEPPEDMQRLIDRILKCAL